MADKKQLNINFRITIDTDPENGKEKSEGVLLKERGIDQAEISAGKVWITSAYDYLKNYARTHEYFMTEDARVQFEMFSSNPPSKRAWGAVILKAKARGIVQFHKKSNVKNPKAHSANANVWKSLIYKK